MFDAISSMELNKAPGPDDGFPAEFYQTFWEVIKLDLMAMFRKLQTGELPLFKLNFGVITLLPRNLSMIKCLKPGSDTTQIITTQ